MSLFDKAKEALGKNPEKTDQGVDKLSEAAKGKFGEHGDKIDQATDKVKDFLHKPGGGEQPPPGR
ncbi:antitoxin [Amycolatopsis sp. H20-H5]|uniref:antitoxin n=1 Tax=Amycolatopsis sp. H20-H5 TaxID=3046309 RepID=UPI002DB68846|nr:antitoxin [Amycolatopsis sp. H20-H5]MEC3980378.1 antitoxin [Amycolatopsis sp. H20-H5]